MSVLEHPDCHLAHVPKHDGHGETAVWICEYPYRTMRAAGPSAECGDCPVWRRLQDQRAAATRAAELELLEAMAESHVR
jgi:hypothetical protein